MTRNVWIWLVILAGCQGGGKVGIDEVDADADTDADTDTDTDVDTDTDPDAPLGTEDEGFGDTVGLPDVGSGDGAGKYRVEVSVWGDEVSVGGNVLLESELDVRIWDELGSEVQGAAVTLTTLNYGETELTEVNPGHYEGTQFGYDRTYTVEIDGSEGSFAATAIGPKIHVISVGSQPVDVAQSWTIQWAPNDAQFCEIDIRGEDAEQISDIGSYTIPAGDAEYELGETGEERVRIDRWNWMELTNAVPTSWFEIGIRREVDDIDTFDSRTGDWSGEITIDQDLIEERQDDGLPPYEGTAYLLCWPDELFEDGGDPWAWTSAEYPDDPSFSLTDLPPGEWVCIAYLDEDSSDDGQSPPQGPDEDEPFREIDVEIDPNETQQRDVRLDEIW